MTRFLVNLTILLISLQTVLTDNATTTTYCNGRLLQGVSINAVCNYNSSSAKCVEDIRPNTNIQINCAFGFTRTPEEPQFLKCLPNGTFDKKPQRCEQSCGHISPSLTGLSKNGVAINSSDAPWHVSIHEFDTIAYTYICSGSILSPRVIITVAHCFWDESTSTLRNYTEDKIIAGRNSSDFTNMENEFSQIVNVAEVHIPSEYSGRAHNQKGDIAFLKLDIPLKYSETIAPICIPDLKANALNYILSNQKGYISIFGSTHSLETLKMTTLSYHDCLEKSAIDAPLADDKFCIYNTDGGSVCRGSSGAGYFIETRNSNEDRLYTLFGVLSNTVNSYKDCTNVGEGTYMALTNIIYAPAEFKKKLQNAIKADEELF